MNFLTTNSVMSMGTIVKGGNVCAGTVAAEAAAVNEGDTMSLGGSGG